ncbi:hypothetical protein LJC74_01380 [Eubacteriales bacterium OttesenSCG-928-A19]|nr:hypothetical protein [Eubacteriales bacterium OttesenSCG-928-A19]
MNQVLRRQWMRVRTASRKKWWAVPLAAVTILLPVIGFRMGGLPCAMLALGYVRLPWRLLIPRDIVEEQPVQNIARVLTRLQKMLFFSVVLFPAQAALLMGAQALCQGLLLMLVERGQRLGHTVTPTALLSGLMVQALSMAFCEPGALGAGVTLTSLSAVITAAWCAANHAYFTREMRMRLHTA